MANRDHLKTVRGGISAVRVKGIDESDKTLLLCSEASLNSRVLIPLDLDGYLSRWRGSKASTLKS